MASFLSCVRWYTVSEKESSFHFCMVRLSQKQVPQMIPNVLMQYSDSEGFYMRESGEMQPQDRKVGVS